MFTSIKQQVRREQIRTAMTNYSPVEQWKLAVRHGLVVMELEQRYGPHRPRITDHNDDEDEIRTSAIHKHNNSQSISSVQRH